jgi:hypothetical protein
MREKRSARKPENHPGYKISLTRKSYDFNVFDTFYSLERCRELKTATALMVHLTQEETYHNEASADGPAGSEGSFPGGLDLGKLLCPQ